MNSPYLRGIVMIVVPIQLLFSLYFLLRGHSEPGGGFIGGLIAASALVIFVLSDYLTIARAKQIYEKLIGVGLFLIIAAGLFSALYGLPILTGIWGPEIYIPTVGEVKLGNVLVFDIGVYLLVMGFGALFTSLAREQLK